jgi:metallophosphoesterase (TIGR00282 family)
MKILFIGDIVGKPGRRALRAFLPKTLDEYGVDLTIANGENSAAGLGITASVSEELFKLGVDVITSGNHIWDKREALTLLPKDNRILRPLNYPPGTPGVGSVVVKARGGIPVGIINLEGRVFMRPNDCPFRAAEKEIENISGEAPVIIVDFHAEATSEKLAMGWFLDGKATAVLGTHTHVQTADERILPKGTAFITDVGMTGPSDSVIGVKHDIIVRRFLTALPEKFETAKEYPQFQAVVIDTDSHGRSRDITRLNITEPRSLG